MNNQIPTKSHFKLTLVIGGLALTVAVAALLFLSIFPRTNRAKDGVEPFLTQISQSPGTKMICEDDIRSIELSTAHPYYTVFFEMPLDSTEQTITQAARTADYPLTEVSDSDIQASGLLSYGTGVSRYAASLKNEKLTVTTYTHDVANNDKFGSPEVYIHCQQPIFMSENYPIATDKAVVEIVASL